MRNLAVALLLLATPTLASAQATDPAPDPTAAEARLLFERGHELAEARRFSEAVVAFEESLELVDRPSTVFNLALCFYALERYVEAIATLERFERSADPAEDPASLADASRMLAHAREAIATIVIEVEPADAYVVVDGTPVGGAGTRTLSVNPGPHVVHISHAHHDPMLLEIAAAPGSEQRRAVALVSTRRPARLEVELLERPAARILVDGRDVGAGRASLDVDAGRHAIRVVEPGVDPVDRHVALDWNERVRLLLGPPAPPTSCLVEEPAFWGILGGVVGAVAIGVLVGVLAAELQPSPDGGTTGEVLSIGPVPSGVIIP
ncbi:MAG: PEGA domain-containing protein [Sandaracinaceae bacterium]|nr:PEGA domain-containing protein [Sandaracinaceae bacterium]